MAGNPLQKLFPIIKKNIVIIWMSVGFILFLKMRYNEEKIYKWVYSENDFQRRYHLERIRKFTIQEEQRRSKAAAAVDH